MLLTLEHLLQVLDTQGTQFPPLGEVCCLASGKENSILREKDLEQYPLSHILSWNL